MKDFIFKILCCSIFLLSLGNANANELPPSISAKKILKKKHESKLVHHILYPNKIKKWIYYASGIASYYGVGDGFQGQRTANGERFNTYKFTCANRWLKFNTKVLVYNINNGLQYICRINDRGPYFQGRIIDLSYAMKETLRINGIAPVKIYIQSD